ncbi:translation initiation factor IF-2 N-terminal domain-containing protein, partial [Adlercreutzia mucosicola]|uniref:translation initiation factor IF-2 N-terminal domain-containing protein n=1 Tax=Adlercreutzia mucosicola TaxID=580026 RepID=UPI00214B7AF8
MASMRVHELAKEFDMSSADLLDRLKDMKIPAKSHASMLNEAYVDKIRKNLEPEIRARAGALAAEAEDVSPSMVFCWVVAGGVTTAN